MIAPPRSPRRDDWLVAILTTLVPAPAEQTLHALLRDQSADLWRATEEAGLVDSATLLSAIAHHTHFPVAAAFPTSEALRTAIPERSARRFHVVPTAVTATTLTIATSTPYNLTCDQFLAFTTRRSILVTLASPKTIDARLDALYRPHHDIERLLASLATNHQVDSLPVTEEDQDDLAFAPDDRPIVKLVDAMLAAAISARASDVHLEPHDSGVAVRHRIDGMLHHALTLPKRVALPIISRLKVMGRMDIADRVRPQDGHTRIALNGAPIDLRLSTLPASLGEKLVIRLLDPSATLRPLDALGFSHQNADRLRRLLDIREGLILITGPTGSGKTTTLYSALHVLQQRGLNIVTVEDPVEYRIPGIVQVQVNVKAGLTFAAALKSILRQDPDVILIGEIRDPETAAIAIQAAHTGHLVFATLHTLDSASSIARLHDLHVSPAKVASALKGIIAQRLLRKCCECRREHAPDRRMEFVQGRDAIDSTQLPAPIPQFCARCAHTGYYGRVAAAEIVLVDSTIQRHVAAGEPATTLLSVIRESGAMSLWTSALRHVEDGSTTLEEVHRAIEPDVPSDGAHPLPSNAPPPPSGQPPTRPPKPPKRSAMAPEEGEEGDEGDGRDQRDQRTDWNARELPAIRRGVRYDTGGNQAYPSSRHLMTHIAVGVIDVYLIDPSHDSWRALALQRALGTRSPGSWEAVHGKIDPDETPEQAAVREVREETGLEVQRLYNVMVQPFYLHKSNTVQLSVVFCAFVDSEQPVTLSEEHQAYMWCSLGDVVNRYTWPRAIQAIRGIEKLLSGGNAGPAEDVMRIL